MRHEGPVNAVLVTPDGRQIVSAGDDSTIRVWDLATEQQVLELTGHTTAVLCLALTPDATRIISGSVGGTVRVWDRSTGEQVGEPLGGYGNGVRAVTTTPDGLEIIAAFSGETDSTADVVIATWNRGTGKEIGPLLTGDPGTIRALVTTLDGTELIAVYDDGTIQRSHRASGDPGRPYARLAGAQAVAISSDREVIVLGEDDVLWVLPDSLTDMAAGPQHLPDLQVSSVAISPDGEWIAVGDHRSRIAVWRRTPSLSEAARWVAHNGPVRAVAFTPDSRVIVSGGRDGSVRMFDLVEAVPPAGERLAEVVSDLESREDRLGIANDVQMIAAVVAAESTVPPLSIALLGDWGIGKSSFMRQVWDRVEDLAGREGFAGNVRQVRFNAWHYSDDHLWVGLVEHLFRELARRADPGEAERVDDLEAALSAKEAERDRLDADLKAVEEHTGWVRRVLLPLRSARLFGVALRELGRDLRAAGWRVAVALLVIAVGVAAIVLGAGVLRWLGGVLVVLAPAVLAWRRLETYAAQAKRDLENRKSKVDREILQVEATLTRLDPARRLEGLLTEISTGDRYETYRGLTGRIHSDLQRLGRDLTAAREYWRTSGAKGTPPLQRIVLYVDDLDRCRPRRVVDVLQAVNLLLTMELFVVVVAVDPRWLLRALEKHHKNLSEDGAVAYLDKIFHLPVALRPMGEHAAGYLRSLLPADDDDEPPAEQAPPAPETRPEPRPAGTATNEVSQQRATPEPPPAPTIPSPEGLRCAPGNGSSSPCSPRCCPPRGRSRSWSTCTGCCGWEFRNAGSPSSSAPRRVGRTRPPRCCWPRWSAPRTRPGSCCPSWRWPVLAETSSSSSTASYPRG
ncbi:P-loop NTPase fold protein [Actinophytocola sp.]|uniref:P-loop NTPase fold protein n=1 Tax=Actinophytocola sp. TaxID=1872138 RepID=UPI002D806962|nr:P-loop NTPase fold protein [Actinophytocola sp.]HET9142576.1 P-loop NTPase fold protein [Actinophytocola sp.]